MAEICKNCEHDITLNFCSNCGQKKLKRIDRTYIKDEIQYTVFHMNKGFLYSVKKLLIAPGKTTREFIEGNRVNHYKPLLLVFVLAGISAFLTHIFADPVQLMVDYYNANESLERPPPYMLKMNAFIMKNYAFVMFLSVPPMALVSWLSFKKWGYNYYENIIINANFFSLYLVLNILIIIPLQYFLKGVTNLGIMLPAIIGFFLIFILFFWFYIDLYNKKAAGDTVLRIFLMFALTGIGYILTIILSIIGFFAYAAITGTDLREMFPQQ